MITYLVSYLVSFFLWYSLFRLAINNIDLFQQLC